MRATLDLPTKHVEYQTKITAAAVSPRMIMPFRPPLRKKEEKRGDREKLMQGRRKGRERGPAPLGAIHI